MAVQLPPLTQSIILDPTGVKAGAGAYQKSMGSVNKATTAANMGMAGLSNNLSTVAFRAQTAGRAIRNKLGLPLIAIGGLAAKAFADFEATMVRIESLVGVSSAGVNRFAENIKKVSIETGRGPKELAEAMFFIASAGLRGADATNVLSASARGAALGLGQTKVVADAATSAINAYGIENLSATDAVDVLTAAVREGKVEADRLAPAIGKAIPVASAMGIEFHEVASAIAAMTRTGTDARTSAIQLRQIMQSLLDPSRQTTNALKEMGIAEGELRRQADEEGLLAVLKRLRDLSIENADAFADVFPNVRALAGALDITGANLEENEAIFRALANSTGDTAEGFGKVQQTIKQQVAEAFANLQVQMIELGKSMGPLVDIFVFFVDTLASVIEFVANNKVIVTFTAVIAALAVTVGTMATAFAIGAQVMVGFTATLANAGGVAAILTGKLTVLKFAMISTGIGALIVGLGTALAFITKFGNDSASVAKQASDLRMALDDIRIVAGKTVRPLIEMGGALGHIGDAAARSSLMSAFFDTYKESIDDALALNSELGKIQAEESLMQMFFGRGDTAENRDALEGILNSLQISLRDFQIFDRLFEADELGSYQQALTEFLEGSNVEAQTSRAFQTLTERVMLIAEPTMKELGIELKNMAEASEEQGLNFDDILMAKLGLGGTAGQHTPSAHIAEFAEKSLREALEVPATLMDEAIRSGNMTTFAEIYMSVMESAGKAAKSFGMEEDEAMKIMELNLIQGMQILDDFQDDTERGLNNLQRILIALDNVSDEKRDFMLSEFDEGGAKWWEDLSKAYNTYLHELEMEFELHGTMRDPIDRHYEALRIAADEIERVARAQGESNRIFEKTEPIMQDVFDAMETGFATAESRIKSFQKRFDMLIGTATDFNSLQRDFVEGQVDLADTFADLGGVSLLGNSEAARNANAALEDQIALAGEFGAAVFGASGDMDVAEAAMNDYLDAIAAVAAGEGVDMGEFTKVMNSLQVNPNSLEVITSVGDDPASQALIERAEAMQSLGLSHFGPAGEAVGEAFGTGVELGIFNSEGDLVGSAVGLMNRLIAILTGPAVLNASSPSKVTAEKIGKPFITGIIAGIEEERRNMVNAAMNTVEAGITAARKKVGAVMGAIRAELDMQDAQRRINTLARDTAGAGISEREELMGKIMKRRVDEAKRAMRLGQGHLDELQLAVLDAQHAQDDFDAEARSGSQLQQAQLDLMQSGLDAAEAQARMRMEGESAIGMFKELATTMGIAVGGINQLLDTGSDPNDMLSKIFSDDMIDKINAAAEDMAWIKESAEGISKVEPPKEYLPRIGRVNITDFGQGDSAYDMGLAQSPGQFDMNPAQMNSMFGTYNPDFSAMDIGALNTMLESASVSSSQDLIVNGDVVNNFGGAPGNAEEWTASIKNKARDDLYDSSVGASSPGYGAGGSSDVYAGDMAWLNNWGGYG